MQLLPKSPVGKKILMALTGQAMILFVVAHALGNSTIYLGRLNEYAERLRELPPLIWAYRTVMFTLFSAHVIVGVQLYLENRVAKPEPYAAKKSVCATFAGKTMLWTGLVIASFLAYHLLHFTVQVINPGLSAGANMDAAGRPDVFMMVVLNFRSVFTSSVYVFAMVALALHLSHGIQSSFQTLGLNNDRTRPVITRAGSLAAYVLFAGYVSIPIVILIGLLKG